MSAMRAHEAALKTCSAPSPEGLFFYLLEFALKLCFEWHNFFFHFFYTQMVVSAKSQKTKIQDPKLMLATEERELFLRQKWSSITNHLDILHAIIHRIYSILSRSKTYTFCQHKGMLNLQNTKKSTF